MDTTDPNSILHEVCSTAISIVASKTSICSELAENDIKLLDSLLMYSERAKGVLTVVITSLVYKIIHPEQDVRKHQSSIPGGYAGRGFDSRFITPFMKEQKFPAMAESGWLTRALEQKAPYDNKYTGAITPKELKSIFLSILKRIESGANPKKFLSHLFQGLILQRDTNRIELSKPTSLTIAAILRLLDKHFTSKYRAEGASRLPVLAIYSAYVCLIGELKRYEGKTLLPLESHTSSDKSSGVVGDINVNDEKERVFESIEIKHGKPIDLQIVKDAYNKFKSSPIDRYYILSTADCEVEELRKIEEEVLRIKNLHGCQVIVNGVMPTLKYYLRLLSNPAEFIFSYTTLLESDKALKFEHKQRWNEIVSSGT